MVRFIPSGRSVIRVLAALVFLTAHSPAQEPKRKAETAAEDVEKLIDRLMEVDQQDTGYSGAVAGSNFLPLGVKRSSTMLLGQKPSATSDTMKSLVKLVVKALPALLDHLGDERPTKIKLLSKYGVMVYLPEGMDREETEKLESLDTYTITVADLCYVAIGQIVNRNYQAVRYQPSAIVYITSVTRSPKLREDLVKEWGGLTPAKHRDSLARDVLESWNDYIRNYAAVNLAYYYPAELEGVALKLLKGPSYDRYEVQKLIVGAVYPARSVLDRKAVVESYVTWHGEIARDGIRWELFEELKEQEIEEKRTPGTKRNPPIKARECLIELYGLPTTVKSEDRPTAKPISTDSQQLFLESLRYDRSEKIDRICKAYMVKADTRYLAMKCMNRLVGRGYDAEIEASIKHWLPLEREERGRFIVQAYEAKLGWTPLHAAVDLGLPDYVEAALAEKIPIDARGRDGRTALHVAAGEGKEEIVQALLTAKADPNVKDAKGRLAVELAAREDHALIVHRLLDCKSEVHDVFGVSIAGMKDRLAALVKGNPEIVHARNSRGLLPLHVAAREGHGEATRLLISAGSDVKAVDDVAATPFNRQYSNLLTPLHLAAMSRRTEVAAILLDAGADVNAVERRGGYTPLHIAAWNGDVELVDLLLARKADRTIKDDRRRTPFMLAKENGHASVAKLLGE